MNPKVGVPGPSGIALAADGHEAKIDTAMGGFKSESSQPIPQWPHEGCGHCQQLGTTRSHMFLTVCTCLLISIINDSLTFIKFNHKTDVWNLERWRWASALRWVALAVYHRYLPPHPLCAIRVFLLLCQGLLCLPCLACLHVRSCGDHVFFTESRECL